MHTIVIASASYVTVNIVNILVYNPKLKAASKITILTHLLLDSFYKTNWIYLISATDASLFV